MEYEDDGETVKTIMAAVESRAAEALADTTASVYKEEEETLGTEGSAQKTSTEASSDHEGPSNSESDSYESDLIPSNFEYYIASFTEEADSSGSSDTEGREDVKEDRGMDRHARVWHLLLAHVLNVGRI